MAALELVRWHRHKLAPAVATGWLRRAERLLADDPECVEYGYLQLRRASDAMVAVISTLARGSHRRRRRSGTALAIAISSSWLNTSTAWRSCNRATSSKASR